MVNESLNDALIECVKACGGSKAVGLALWPAKGVEAAQRQLLSALNPERAEKLALDELVLLLRMARERNCHVGMEYLAAELGYAEPIPVEPRDITDQLRREYIEAARSMAKIAERIERLDRPTLGRAA